MFNLDNETICIRGSLPKYRAMLNSLALATDWRERGDVADLLDFESNSISREQNKRQKDGGPDFTEGWSDNDLVAYLRQCYRLRSELRKDQAIGNTDSKVLFFMGVMRVELEYVEVEIDILETIIQGKGLKLPPQLPEAGGRNNLDALLEPITNKIQLKLAFRKKFDELKSDTPAELWPDLEKAFRQAMEQLDKQ